MSDVSLKVGRLRMQRKYLAGASVHRKTSGERWKLVVPPWWPTGQGGRNSLDHSWSETTLYSHPKMWPSFCLPFLIMKGKIFELVLGLLSNFGGQEGAKVV